VREILIDTSVWAGPALANGWFPGDIKGGNIAPMEPVMLEGARLDPAKDESERSATPALDVGRELARLLGADPGAVRFENAPPDADVIAVVQSAPLRDRVQQMMERSDNVLAEAIGREVAVKAGIEASFGGAVEALTRALRDAGINTDGLSLQDCSGLSDDDRLTPALLGSIGVAAAGDGKPQLRPLLDAFPIGAATGTLAGRFDNAQTGVGAGWVRAKTGTLNDVAALSGYVIDLDGRALTFTLIANGPFPYESSPVLDDLVAQLRMCGCG
jgi:D-alanyl-D-alanine carboxypeptidase/D-alanyl-D-alanine-endopeptidase (penicillin-binding protein 4)